MSGIDWLLRGGSRRRLGRRTNACILLHLCQLLFCFLLQVQEGPERELRGNQACVLPLGERDLRDLADKN